MRFQNLRSVLVTGATGFVGSHIVELLLDKHPEADIYVTKRWHLSRLDNLDAVKSKVKVIDCDLTDPVSTEDLIKQSKPEIIFHCAAESFVSPSWRNPHRYMDVNYNGTVNILEAIRKYSKDTIIHIPGSGEEYGDIKQEQLPITLDTVMNPVNPYAVSKVAQDLISYVYHESYGINVVRTRAFNHEGPRRLNVFGLPWYAYQIALIVNQEQQPILTTGHTGDKRNFTHVSDMVNAYYLSTQLCDFGKLYLVGNNNPEYECTFREGLEMLINASKIDKKIEIVQDERWVRPTNVPFLIADCSEFVNKTNWVPKKNLQTIIEDTMEYWLQNYKKFPSLNLVSSVKPLMEN